MSSAQEASFAERIAAAIALKVEQTKIVGSPVRGAILGDFIVAIEWSHGLTEVLYDYRYWRPTGVVEGPAAGVIHDTYFINCKSQMTSDAPTFPALQRLLGERFIAVSGGLGTPRWRDPVREFTSWRVLTASIGSSIVATRPPRPKSSRSFMRRGPATAPIRRGSG